MGLGKFNPETKKFDLEIAFQYDASSQLGQWKKAFGQASNLLRDATNGRHQFGTIKYSYDSGTNQGADVWVFNDGRNPRSPYKALGKLGLHITLSKFEAFRPFVIVHELGHYAYDLRDEYLRPGGAPGAECIGGTTANACIMEADYRDGDRYGNLGQGGELILGRVRAFCATSNHDPDRDTWQHDKHARSCWETMVQQPFNLTPITDSALGPVPAEAGEDIVWIERINQQRFVLVMNRSDNRADNELTEAGYGINWWVDQSIPGDYLGIVSYADSAIRDFPLQEIESDDDRREAQDAVDGISLGGPTSVESGLRRAYDQIVKAGPPATTEVAVLLSDGLHEEGEKPLEEVLQGLERKGIRVYTIGVGPMIDAALLDKIATRTGGVFYHIDPSRSPEDPEFDIGVALQEISGIARQNGGLVRREPKPWDKADLQEGEVFEVLIEEGSQMATFVLSWKNPEELLSLKLEPPENDQEDAFPPDNVRQIESGRPYVGFQVIEPEPGMWKLTVEPKDAGGYCLLAFSQNPRIDGGLMSPSPFYQPGDVIPLQLQVYFDQPVTGLDVDGQVRRPNGKWEQLEFSDDGDEKLDDEAANDAIYSSLIPDWMTDEPGIYTVVVSVDSDTDSVGYPQTREWPDEYEAYQGDPIPSFRRQFRLAVAVRQRRA